MKTAIRALLGTAMLIFGILTCLFVQQHRAVLDEINWAVLALLGTSGFFLWRSYNNERQHKPAIIVAVISGFGILAGLFMASMNTLYLAILLVTFGFILAGLVWDLSVSENSKPQLPSWDDLQPESDSSESSAMELSIGGFRAN